MGVPKQAIQAAMHGATAPLATSIGQKVQLRAKGSTVDAALALQPTSAATRVARLFAMLSVAVGDTARTSRLTAILSGLRRDLPVVLKRIPLKLAHLGFERIDDLVQFLGEALFKMQTEATTIDEFASGIKGWRWNLAGRLLFERLVKYHPQLHVTLGKMAASFMALVNQEVQRSAAALVDIHGNPRKVRGQFGEPPLKVMRFSLKGSDGVWRDFTDFGYISKNPQGLWVMLPIELKMPDALGKVAAQFEQFIPRLESAQKLIAWVEKDGKEIKTPIEPADLLFMQHDQAQIAIAPMTKKRFEKAFGTGQAVGPNDVASVVDIDQGVSPAHAVIYYRVRLLVQRDWLESIVRVITDPP